MGKPSVRKRNKQKERERQARQKKLVAAERRRELERRQRYRDCYPEFRFDTKEADSDFAEAVKVAVSQINFEDRNVFSGLERLFYHVVKMDGAEEATHWLKVATDESAAAGDKHAHALYVQAILGIGYAVYRLIPDVAKYLPFNDAQFSPEAFHIRVTIRSLRRSSGSGGTVYYSRRKPTLDIAGKQKVVAFSRHAIERTCERLTPRWREYGGAGDAFSYLDQCIHFEKCELHPAQLAFTFYNLCADERFWSELYVREVLGKENVDPEKGSCYYRIGYCPAVVEGEFVKAKTLLFPGFVSTPEYGAIFHSSLPRSEKEELMRKARNLDTDSLQRDCDFSTIKWFHDNGVPQVVQLKKKVFADYWE